jgi:hypothetical protein
VGGFLEDDAVATVGCDDVFYARLLRHYLNGVRIPQSTVRFRHREGNSFDRQWERKFSRPPEDAETTLSGPLLAAEPTAIAAFERRVFEVEQRVRRLRSHRTPGPRWVRR